MQKLIAVIACFAFVIITKQASLPSPTKDAYQELLNRARLNNLPKIATAPSIVNTVVDLQKPVVGKLSEIFILFHRKNVIYIFLYETL